MLLKSGGGVRIMTNPHDVIIRPVVTEHSMAEMGEKNTLLLWLKMRTKLK